MRRVLLLFITAALVFSCNKSGAPVSVTEVRVRVETTFSKLALGEEASGVFPLLWQEGDRISLNGVLSEPMASTVSGSSEAVFVFSAPPGAAPYNLLYPASASNQLNMDGRTIPMCASGSSLDEVFIFHHLACGVRLSLVGDLRVSSLELSAEGGESIAGEFSVSGDGLTPVSALSHLKLEYETPLSLSPAVPMPLYVFFAPGTFTEGLLLTAESPDGISRSWHIATGGTFLKGRMYLIPETAFASREKDGLIEVSLEQMTEESISIEL